MNGCNTYNNEDTNYQLLCIIELEKDNSSGNNEIFLNRYR